MVGSLLAFGTAEIAAADSHAAPLRAAPTQGPPGNSRPSDSISPSDLTMLQKLHDTNQMEIQMGHLAEAKGASKAVKEFGRKLVEDHTRADRQVAAFLKLRGLDVKALATPTSADPAHAMAADQGGEVFDRTFAAQMVKDHDRSIELVEGGRRATSDPQLKVLYDALLPVLQEHRQTAQKLAQGKGRV
jgi:putative membrane protein